MYLLRYGNHGIITMSKGVFSFQTLCCVCSNTRIRSYRLFVFAVAFTGRLEFKAYTWSAATLMCLAKGQLSSADQSYQHIALKFCPLVEGQSHYNALKLTLGSYAEYMYTAEL